MSTFATPAQFARLRIATLALGLIVAAAAGTGVVQLLLFERPSAIKYGITVIVPVIAVSVLASREPVTSTAFLLLLLAPFGGFDSTIQGVQIPLIAPLCVGGVFVAMLCPGDLGWARTNPIPIALTAVLLAVPLLTGSSPGHYLALFATIAAAGFIAARACSRPNGRTVVLAGLVTSAFLQASIELWQLRTGHALNLYGTAGAPVLGRTYFYQFENVFRPSAALYDPISLGNLLSIALPASVALALRTRSVALRLIWSGAGLWIMLGLVLTLSRMSWIAAVAGVVVVVALQERGRLMAVTVIGLSVVCVLATALAVDGSSLGKRLDSVVAPTSTQTANHTEDRTRTRIWAATGQIIAQHPIAGVGFGELHKDLAGNYPDSRPGVHAHSTYLQVLGEGGALAGLAFLMVLLAAILTVTRAQRRRVTDASALAGCLVATLTCWSTDYTIRYLAVAAIFAVVFGAISTLRHLPGERGLARS